MGRSQKWPDLRSPISKIRDIHFVGTGDLIIFRKCHNFPWNIVAVARLESYFVVGSLDLTWWPDLTWHWVEIFTKVAEKMGGKVGENPAALRAAVFSLSSKNLRGGGEGVQTPPPPSRTRVNRRLHCLRQYKITMHFMYLHVLTYLWIGHISNIGSRYKEIRSRYIFPGGGAAWTFYSEPEQEPG